MKKHIILFLFVSLQVSAFAQKKDLPKDNKWGYIDSNLILNQMPDYRQAKKEIDTLGTIWREEMRSKMREIDTLYLNLKEEEVLLEKEERVKRLTAIEAKQDSLNTYRKEVFGFDGQYFKKKKELYKTAQDRLFDAMEIISKEYKLHTLFDKAGDKNLIYINPIHNYSDYVLEKLGLGDSNDTVK